jgi:amino acid transporter
MATAIPEEGGTYVWARRAFGDFAAFQAGLLRWLNSWVDMAIYPVLFASYLAPLFVPAQAGHTVFLSAGPFTLDVHWLMGVVCVIIPMAILNVRGAKSVGNSSVLFALIALGPLAILAALGFFRIFTEHSNPLIPFVVDGSSIPAAAGAGLSLVMWSYCGFDRVGLIAGEIKNPAKVIPKAMLISMLIVVASYVLPLVGALATGGWQTWVAGSFADIGYQLGGSWLKILVIIGGMFAVIGMYSSLLMSNSRSIYVLAADRWAPSVLTRKSRRHHTPMVSIVVSSVIYAAFSTVSFTELVVVDVFLINLLLMISLFALIALRIKEPDLPRPAKIPGGWVGLAAVGLPLSTVICFVTWYTMRDYGATSVWLVVAILVLSTLAYFPARWLHRRSRTDTSNADGRFTISNALPDHDTSPTDKDPTR